MNKKSKHARWFGSAKMVLARHFLVQDTMRLVNGPQADPTKSISSNGAQYVAQQMK
jgi:hypothetical protein